jgi:hypothetical protein
LISPLPKCHLSVCNMVACPLVFILWCINCESCQIKLGMGGSVAIPGLEVKLCRNAAVLSPPPLQQSHHNAVVVIGKTTVISFVCKIMSFNFSYKLCNNLILHSQYVRSWSSVGLQATSTPYFYKVKKCWVWFNYTSSFSSADGLYVLCTTLVWPKLEYASVAWNSITSTDLSKLMRVQRKFAALCYSRFFVGVCYKNYDGILARLNLPTLYSRLQHLDVLFLINVFKNKISCSSIFYSVSVCTPTRIIRNYCTFMANHNFKISPSANSSVSTVSWLRTGRPGFDPWQRHSIFLSLCVQTGSGAHPVSCTMGTGGPFPGGKARPGCDADHSPLSSAKDKNE